MPERCWRALSVVVGSLFRQLIAEGRIAPQQKHYLQKLLVHSGMYGMYALQESVRQMHGTAPTQIPGGKISVCHGVGGMFAPPAPCRSGRPGRDRYSDQLAFVRGAAGSPARAVPVA